MPGDVLTPEELLSYALNQGVMPSKYVNATPANTPGVAGWRLLDADHISTGIMDPNRLGTGAVGAGNLYLADDGTWKPVSTGGGSQNLQDVTDLGNTTTNSIDTAGTKSDYFQLDTLATPTLQPGMFGWDDAYGTADLRLKGNNVTLQLGQEILARVVNKTGADLLESEYKVVRVRVASEGGAQGQRLAVVLAQGNNDPDSVTTLGIVTENILDNQEGFITILGNVNGINTTGSLQGETWVDGDVLYLSPSTPGGLTKVKPIAPNHTVTIGYVVYAHSNQGKIFVKVDNGYELDELHNVLISTPTEGQALVYDETNGVWVNSDPKDILNSTLLTNQTVGGVSSGASYPPGTPLETIVRNILVTYIPPSFNTLRAKNGGTTLTTSTQEIGTVFTVTNVSVNVVADNPNGNPPTNVSVSVSGATTGSGTIASGLTVVVGTNSSLAVTSGNYTRNTNGSVVFTIAGLDANSVSRNTTQTYSFQSYNYFGGASIVVSDDASATAVRDTIKLQRKAFDTDRAWSTTGTTQTNDGANYTYIMYPASYGDLSNVLLGATPVLGAFTKIGDFNILTENGNVTVSYRVYKSNATGAFANGASLTIS